MPFDAQYRFASSIQTIKENQSCCPKRLLKFLFNGLIKILFTLYSTRRLFSSPIPLTVLSSVGVTL